jgi:hypothetical protein
MSKTFRLCRIKVVLAFDGATVEHIEYNWRDAYERVSLFERDYATHILRASHWIIYFLIQSNFNDANNSNGIAANPPAQ